MEKRLINLCILRLLHWRLINGVEIFLGGSQILTPEGFLDNIKKLSSGSSFAEGDDE